VRFESDYVYINVELETLQSDAGGNSMMSTLMIKPISNIKQDRDMLKHKIKVDRGELNSARLRNIFEEKGIDKK
jgi:hypothetical protein